MAIHANWAFELRDGNLHPSLIVQVKDEEKVISGRQRKIVLRTLRSANAGAHSEAGSASATREGRRTTFRWRARAPPTSFAQENTLDGATIVGFSELA